MIQSAIVCCVRLFSLARITELHRLFQQHTSSVTSTILDNHSLLQLSHAAVVGECSIIIGNNYKTIWDKPSFQYMPYLNALTAKGGIQDIKHSS